MDPITALISGIIGLALGGGGMVVYNKAGFNKNQQEAERI